MNNTKLKMQLALLGIQLTGITHVAEASIGNLPNEFAIEKSHANEVYIIDNKSKPSELDGHNCGCNGGNCSC